MFECNDENAPHPGFNAFKKARAKSLGHELIHGDQHTQKHLKRSSENYNYDDGPSCEPMASEKKRRILQVAENKKFGYYNVKKTVLREKIGINQTTSLNNGLKDGEQIPSNACHNKAARARRKCRKQGEKEKDEKRSTLPFIPTPQKVVPNDEPMDTHVQNPTMTIRNHMKRVPPGVEDIDNRVCHLYSSEYAQDIMNYLQAKDTCLPRSDDYISRGEITPKMRGILIDWLGQVQTFEGLSSESLHMCVFMVDRYLTLNLIPLPKLQLLGVACILIASKVIERFPPEITSLCSLTDGAYRPNEVLESEREILNRLRFDLNIPGPIVFLDRYLQIDKHEDMVENVCLYMIDLCLTNTSFVPYSASKIAASSLYLARFLFHNGPIWAPSLTYYTKYTEENLKICVKLFAMAICRAEHSTFQSARTKFNTKTFGHISMNPTLARCRALLTDSVD
ncbi:G2/mitotic-specific cyclin-B [Patella vulgata]|uniref:G2/mitotic-specific cyclin-B n=1 Tax=Patella vulgata TaxID=6465 RepID=UPI00217FEBF5|nr:G2/mitotic-specific cyclin-B [Patella vulgata]